jgi:hypothetical protein
MGKKVNKINLKISENKEFLYIYVKLFYKKHQY